MKNNQNLIFDIDLDELEAIRKQLDATPKEVTKAYNRALSRTAVTIKKLSQRMIKDELQVRNTKILRQRLQQFCVKKSGKGLDELKLWFGLDPFSVGSLKGRTKKNGSRKKPNGATFTPSSPALSSQMFSKGFVAKFSKSKSVFIRTGKGKNAIKEAKIDVDNALQEKIEDEIFDKLPEIFLKHFETDLKGRIAIR